MENYKLTKEEKKKVREAFDLLLIDLGKLWSLSKVKRVSVRINSIDDYGCQLVLEKNRVYIYSSKLNMSLFTDKTTYPVASRHMSGELVASPFVELKTMVELIKQYDRIKSDLESEIIKENEKRSDTIESIESFRKDYDKEASIEIDMPIQNQQQIKVTRDDGKTVGVLNFGDRTIKIVTNGAIVLVNKDEEELERIVAKRKLRG